MIALAWLAAGILGGCYLERRSEGPRATSSGGAALLAALGPIPVLVYAAHRLTRRR